MKTTINLATLEKEIDLYPFLLKLFCHQAYAFAEVPYYNKRVDLIFTGRGFRFFYAVEAKLSNWRKSLKQAALNQLFAQFSYTALPSDKVLRFNKEILDIYAHYGVGLIAVSEKPQIIIPAKRTKYFQLSHYQSVKRILAEASKQKKSKSIGVFSYALSNGSSAMELLQTGADKRERTL